MIQLVCDLDGVVYRGGRVLPGVPEALERLRAQGGRVLFVTNNSTRTPKEAAARIARMVGARVAPGDVCTSPEAAVGILALDDDPVFVVGEEGITSVLTEAGRTVTEDAKGAHTVMVGLTRRIDYDWLAAASSAVRSGARFIATNNDPTYPTEDTLLPGAGAIVAAISTASGAQPEVAGKPHQPMVDLVRTRLQPGPVWVVGDRVDTDIAMAVAGGWESILVMGGVTDAGSDYGDARLVASGLPEAIDLIIDRS